MGLCGKREYPAALRRRRLVFFAVLVVLALDLGPGIGGAALAGKLVMDVSGRARLISGKVKITLTVANQGDEPALDIQAEALADYSLPRSLLVKRLEPGQSVELDLLAQASVTGPGTYIQAVLVNFRDTRNHPFTALADVEYGVGPGAVSPVKALAEPVTLSDRRLVRLKLFNQGTEPLEVKARVFAPRELSAAQPGGALRLEPGQTRTVCFDLWNLTGLAGSVYPVMAVLEHVSKGNHAAKAVKIMATLTPRHNPVLKHLEWWLAAVGAAFVLLVAAQFGKGDRP